jgi:hypothetical protein
MTKKLLGTLSAVAALAFVASALDAATILSSTQRRLFRADTTTGNYTYVGMVDPTDTFISGSDIVEIALFPTNMGLYGVNSNKNDFYKINPNTGQASIIADIGAPHLGLGWAPDPLDSGNPYLWGAGASDDKLYRIDPMTGTAIQRGNMTPPGIGQTLNVTDLAWDGTNMYAVENNYTSLFRINLATGQATQIGTGWGIGPDARMNGLLYLPGEDTLVAQARIGGLGYETSGAIYRIDRVTGLASNPIGPSGDIGPGGVISSIGTGDFADYVIPEPGTIALGLLGLGLAIVRFRRG